MEFLMAIAMVCFAISIYYRFQGLRPVIEKDGKFWIIRIGNKFVDAAILMHSVTWSKLVLWEGTSALYPRCRFGTKEEADLYFKHVCNYVAEGRIYYVH